MSASTLMLLGFLLAIVGELVLATLAYRRLHALDHWIWSERTRALFAQARHNLVALTLSNALDSRSETFRVLYSLQTYVLRRADQYLELSGEMVGAVLAAADPKERAIANKFDAESKKWAPGVSEVAAQTAAGLMYLVVQFSFWRRLIMRIEMKSGAVSQSLRLVGRVAQFVVRLLETIAAAEERHNPELRDLREVQAGMARLANRRKPVYVRNGVGTSGPTQQHA